MPGLATFVCHRHRGRGAMHAMQSLSLDTSSDAFSSEASSCPPFPFHSSPRFAHLNAMPYLPSWIFTEFLSFLLPCCNAPSGILHPQDLNVSQCPSNSSQPASLCPSEQTHQLHAGGTPDLPSSNSVPLSQGPAWKTESAPELDVERDSI